MFLFSCCSIFFRLGEKSRRRRAIARSVGRFQVRETEGSASISISNSNVKAKKPSDAMARKGQQFFNYGLTIVLTVIAVHLFSNLLHDEGAGYDRTVEKVERFPGQPEGLILKNSLKKVFF